MSLQPIAPLDVTPRDASTPREQPLDDATLVARALAGEVSAFEALLRRYNQRVFRTARAVLGNEADAEDAAQQAWLSVYTHLAQWSGRGSFSSWALSIVVRTCIRRKSTMRQERELDEDIRSPAFTPEDEAHRREVRAVLERAIDALPESLRTVLVLADVEGMSGPEIGEALGASDEAVRVRLHRARQRLRDVLDGALERSRGALYPFLGARCDAITHRVLEAVARKS